MLTFRARKVWLAILVIDSYGSVAERNAVSQLEAELRLKDGKTGGIVHCVFIAAFLIPKGKILIEMSPEQPPYLVPDVDLPVFPVNGANVQSEIKSLTFRTAQRPKLLDCQGP